MYRTFSIAVLAAVVLFTTVQAAGARPDRFGSAEMFPGEGVTEASQHGMTKGTCPR